MTTKTQQTTNLPIKDAIKNRKGKIKSINIDSCLLVICFKSIKKQNLRKGTGPKIRFVREVVI